MTNKQANEQENELNYIIEADNHDGTYETLERCGISEESLHRLKVRVAIECLNPMGSRKLSVWHKPTATCIAVWTPNE